MQSSNHDYNNRNALVRITFRSIFVFTCWMIPLTANKTTDMQLLTKYTLKRSRLQNYNTVCWCEWTLRSMGFELTHQMSVISSLSNTDHLFTFY